MQSNEAESLDNSTEYILIIDNIIKMYGKFVAVDQVSLRVERGEFLTLLGPSGSGKSTILMMIAGFQNPTSGKILLNGENILFKPSTQYMEERIPSLECRHPFSLSYEGTDL